MVLDAPGGLFKGGREVIMTIEETELQPVIAPDEMVLWKKVGGKGEFYTGAAGGGKVISLVTSYNGQSFTVGTTSVNAPFSAASVLFKMYRIGTPGTVTAELKLADGNGKPTGAVLATGTTDGDTLTTNAAGEERTITFAAPYTLSPDTQYCIYLYASGVGGGNSLVYKYNAGEVYGGGDQIRSSDSGASWSVDANQDAYFEIGGTGTYILVNIEGTMKQILVGDI